MIPRSSSAPAAQPICAENGQESLKNVAASISRMPGFGGKTREWSPQDAEAALGRKAHRGPSDSR